MDDAAVGRFDPVSGGQRLKTYILRAIVAHPTIESVSGLARCTGLQRNTLYSWFTGTARPTTGKLQAVAECLRVSVVELLEEYEGHAPEPSSAELELKAHREAMERQTAAIERLLQVLTSGAVAAGVLRALEEAAERHGEPQQ